MLDKIMEMVSGVALNAMTVKAGVSVDQATKMLPLVGESLQEGLMSQLTGGNVDDILGMFKSSLDGGLESNDIFGSLKGLFKNKVMTNMGIPESVASLVSGSVMTSIIGSLTDKIQVAGDTNNIDASSLMNVLGGGESMLGTITGLMGRKLEGGTTDSLKDAATDKLGKFPPLFKGGSDDVSIKA